MAQLTVDESSAKPAAGAVGPVSTVPQSTQLPSPRGSSEDLLTQAEIVYRGVVADPKQFGPRAVALVNEARAAEDAESLVLALRALAWFERWHLSNERAKALLDEAARVARRNGLLARLGEVLITRAAVNHELGRLTAAQKDLDAAGELAGGERVVALIMQQAVLYQNLGRLGHAAALYREILDRDNAEIDIKAKAANNFSIIEIQRGYPDAAAELIEQAGELAGKVGPALSAGAASTRAWISTQMGRLSEGIELFDEAARLHVEADLPLADHYLDYVDALVNLRLIPEAYELAQRSAKEFERQAVHLMAGEGQLRVAELALLQGDLAAAELAAADARRRFAAQRRRGWRARGDAMLCEIRLQSGTDLGPALVSIRRAADTLDTLGLTSYAVDAHLTAGRIALALNRPGFASTSLRRAGELARQAPVLTRLKGRLALALAASTDRARLQHCRVGLRDLAQHRAAFASIELRVRASGHGAELGRLGLEILLEHGTPAQVLSWMERTRAAALVAVDPVGDIGIDDDLAALRLVQMELLEVRREGVEEPAALRVRQRQIEDRIRHLTWMTQSLAGETATVESTSDLRRALDGRTLVEYGVSQGRVFAVVVSSRRTTVTQLGRLADMQREIDQLLFALRRLSGRARSEMATLAAMASAELALRHLKAWLIDSLPIPVGVPLVVSPAGGLRRMPWSALWESAISIVPAASFWRRTKDTPKPPGKVLLVAGPELSGAAEEVAALAGIHDSAVLLSPPDSTIDAVVTALHDADFAHMACHGRLRSDNPAFSGLQLQDGLLTLHELDIRQLAPHRMVIAACESAVDTAYEGNEVLGFVSALMARGTCGLVASIVVVPDAAAVRLMVELHRQVAAGKTLDTALFLARDGLDKDDPHDFVNWCAFNAYGAA